MSLYIFNCSCALGIRPSAARLTDVVVRPSENYLLLVATACRWTFPTELASSKMKWQSCIGPRAGEERGGQNEIRRTAHQLTTVSVSIRWWSVERTWAVGGWLVDESTEREKKGRLSRQQELGQSRAGVPETSQFLTRQAQMQIMHTCSPPLGLFVPLHQLHVVGG